MKRKTAKQMLGVLLLGICVSTVMPLLQHDTGKMNLYDLLQNRVVSFWVPQVNQTTISESVSSKTSGIQNAMEMLCPVLEYARKNDYEMLLEDSGTSTLLAGLKVEETKPNKKEASKEKAGDVVIGKKMNLSAKKLQDFNYLLGHFYTVDHTTTIKKKQLNTKKLLGKSMKIDNTRKGPKILIFHSHSQEAFADSNGKESTSIVGMGSYLTEQLNALGIETLHHKGVYDLVHGKMDRSKAYDLAEVEVKKIIQKNPSIQVAIDLHRDGVSESTHLVTKVNGKRTAQIMFFNGMSYTKKQGAISYLKNPYLEDNLAFSLQMKLECEKNYPGFARRIYLKGYRYNLHLLPKSLLIEAGAQNNTVQEMKNAMEVLAPALYHVLVNEK